MSCDHTSGSCTLHRPHQGKPWAPEMPTLLLQLIGSALTTVPCAYALTAALHACAAPGPHSAPRVALHSPTSWGGAGNQSQKTEQKQMGWRSQPNYSQATCSLWTLTLVPVSLQFHLTDFRPSLFRSFWILALPGREVKHMIPGPNSDCRAL